MEVLWRWAVGKAGRLQRELRAPAGISVEGSEAGHLLRGVYGENRRTSLAGLWVYEGNGGQNAEKRCSGRVGGG